VLDDFPPSGNGVIPPRKLRKAFLEVRLNRSFNKSLVARREAPDIFGKAYHSFTIVLKWGALRWLILAKSWRPSGLPFEPSPQPDSSKRCRGSCPFASSSADDGGDAKGDHSEAFAGEEDQGRG
jgi:hypothetical protein